MSEAAEELEVFERQAPGAVELAVHASIAAHVEGELLRRLRVRFAPHVDAGAEADLWFGPLVESWSASGFTLSPSFVPLLQERFRQMDRREEIAGAIVEFHQSATPAVAMQERIAWLALERGEAARAEIEAELEKALASLGDESRADGVARWAAQALSRLPEVARKTDAAAVLELAAAVRAGSPWSFQHGEERGFPRGAQLALPNVALSREKKVWLRLGDGRLEVVANGSGAEVTAPDTRPVILEVSWGQGSQRRLLMGEVGRSVGLSPAVASVELRTLAGDRYRVRSRSGAAPLGVEKDPLSLLQEACVPFAWGEAEGTAYFAEPHWLVTAAHLITDCPVNTRFRVGTRVAVLSHSDPEADAAAFYLEGGVAERSMSKWPPDLGRADPNQWMGGVIQGAEFSAAYGQVVRSTQGGYNQVVAELQHKLEAMGFNPGEADGVFGPITAAAVAAFQRANGIPEGVLVGARTLAALGLPVVQIETRYVGPSPARLTAGSPIVTGGAWSGHVTRSFSVPTGTEYTVTPRARIARVIDRARHQLRELKNFGEVRASEIEKLVSAAQKLRGAAIVGPPGSGRTRALASALIELQRNGLPGAWLDASAAGGDPADGEWIVAALGHLTARELVSRLVRTACAALGRRLPKEEVGAERVGWFLHQHLGGERFALAIDDLRGPPTANIVALVSLLASEPQVTLLFGASHPFDAGIVDSDAGRVLLQDLDDRQLELMARQAGSDADLHLWDPMREMLGRSPLLWHQALSGVALGIPPVALLDPRSSRFRQVFGAHLDGLRRWLELYPDAEAAFQHIAQGETSVPEGSLTALQRIGLVDLAGRFRAGIYDELLFARSGLPTRAAGETLALPPSRRSISRPNGPWKHSVIVNGHAFEVELRRSSGKWALKVRVTSTVLVHLTGTITFVLDRSDDYQRHSRQARRGFASILLYPSGASMLRVEIGQETATIDLADIPGVPEAFLKGQPPRKSPPKKKRTSS